LRKKREIGKKWHGRCLFGIVGRRNLANNKQYYRDATNHYYQAIAWAEKVPCVEEETVSNEETPNTDLLEFAKAKLDEQISILYANATIAHLQLKNWGHFKDDATKAISFSPRNVKAWYRLANKPDPCPVVRVHPAVTLKQILTDSRMVVPSFICSLFLFPENHPAHKEFLKEHKCVGIIQPN